jgi:hypothetical protein
MALPGDKQKEVFMKYLIIVVKILTVLWPGKIALCEAKDSPGDLPAFSSASAAVRKSGRGRLMALPYVYTEWKHFTVKNGLPNDHVFAIKADGAKVWVGTENGLVCIDKQTGKIKSWKEKDGLPWRVVALDWAVWRWSCTLQWRPI